MKLGFVTAILPELNLNDVLTFAAMEDYDCVEVMCWPAGKAERKFAGVTHVDVTDFTQAAADDVNAMCDLHGVELSGLGYYPNLLSADEAEAQLAYTHLQRVMDAAHLLGLHNVNTFVGADHRKNWDDNLRTFEKVWPDLIRHAEQRDLYIGIENCPMLFTFDEWPAGKNLAYSPAMWRKMFDIIPSPHFGLNYDPSHLLWMMMDYVRPLYDFRSRVFHAHAKDMRIETDKLNETGILGLGWSTPKIPGLGQIDWHRFVSALTDIAFDGALCVEVEDDAFSKDLESRKNSLRLSRNVLRPLVV